MFVRSQDYLYILVYLIINATWSLINKEYIFKKIAQFSLCTTFQFATCSHIHSDCNTEAHSFLQACILCLSLPFGFARGCFKTSWCKQFLSLGGIAFFSQKKKIKTEWFNLWRDKKILIFNQIERKTIFNLGLKALLKKNIIFDWLLDHSELCYKLIERGMSFVCILGHLQPLLKSWFKLTFDQKPIKTAFYSFPQTCIKLSFTKIFPQIKGDKFPSLKSVSNLNHERV